MSPVLLIGATGLIGGRIASILQGEAHSLVRRATGRPYETVAASEDWPALAKAAAAEVAISALGTTMRKAGSDPAFRAVDFDMVVDFARGAHMGGTRRMIAVSSVGADPQSRNFYLRTKGEMEMALRAIGFDRLDILRPGLLRGARGADRRLGERIGISLSPLMNLFLRGSLDRFAAIDGETVAVAAVNLTAANPFVSINPGSLTLDTPPGANVHHNREITVIANAP